MGSYYHNDDHHRSNSEDVNRIYVGNLPEDVGEREVEREFSKFGKILKCDLKRTSSGLPFAFIEFDDPRDAKDAIDNKHDLGFTAPNIRVEVPFNARSDGRRGGKRGEPPKRGKYVVHVTGLPLSGSWQDLKDHVRKAGECGHADVFRDGSGEVSFFRLQDAEAAIDMFDGSTFRSHEGEKSHIKVVAKDMGGHGYGREGDRGGGAARRSRSYDRYAERGGDRGRDRGREYGDRGRERERGRDRDRGRDRERERDSRYSRRMKSVSIDRRSYDRERSYDGRGMVGGSRSPSL